MADSKIDICNIYITYSESCVGEWVAAKLSVKLKPRNRKIMSFWA